MNIAFIGTGSIANKMAKTIQELPDIHLYAVASRNQDNVRHFANTYHINHFYTDYHEFFTDDNIDLVYIATPHHLHYDITKECLTNKLNVLCEKPFTVNAKQAKELAELAKTNHCFLCEALWPRFLPSRFMLENLLSMGIIGEVSSINATLGYQLSHLPRISSAESAGGSLMDLGIYLVHMSSLLAKSPIKNISANCIKNQNGIDLKSAMILMYHNNITACLISDVTSYTDRTVLISGSKGYIKFAPVNNCKNIYVFNSDHQIIQTLNAPPQISGYEYQLLACKKAISNAQPECSDAPLKDTIHTLETLDTIRSILNIQFPFEH